MSRYAWLAILLFVALLGTACGADQPKPLLPTLKEKDWSKFYLVYEQKTFIATMDTQGVLWIHLRDNKGNNIGQPIRFGVPACWYPADRRMNWRKITEFTNPPKPQSDPMKLKLEGKFEGGVEFEMEYQFRGNVITVSGGYKDPGGIDPPSVFRIATFIPPAARIPKDMPQKDREKLLDGMTLKTREVVDGRHKTYKYHYAKTITFAGTLDKAEIEGPWGQRVIKFEGKRNDHLRGWAYPGYCPWQGYQFYQDARDNEIKHYKAEQIIKIE